MLDNGVSETIASLTGSRKSEETISDNLLELRGGEDNVHLTVRALFELVLAGASRRVICCDNTAARPSRVKCFSAYRCGSRSELGRRKVEIFIRALTERMEGKDGVVLDKVKGMRADERKGLGTGASGGGVEGMGGVSGDRIEGPGCYPQDGAKQS